MVAGEPVLVGQAVSPAIAMAEYRRRLPHYQPDDAPTAGHAFVAQDRALDRHSLGPAWLQDPCIGDLVARAILMGEVERHFYELCACVVMPNHVHMLILPRVALAVLMRWLKGSTARSASRILGRTGQPFWQDESWDHYLRNSDQLNRIAAYIEGNPVSAGLVDSAERWPWSSAGWIG